MIIENGTIEFKLKQGGGIDPETGYPIEPAATWGQPIPCQYIPNNNSFQGRANGEHFTVASYQILIDGMYEVASEQLRLKDAAGKEIGQFSLISVEPLRAVDEIKIMV